MDRMDRAYSHRGHEAVTHPREPGPGTELQMRGVLAVAALSASLASARLCTTPSNVTSVLCPHVGSELTSSRLSDAVLAASLTALYNVRCRSLSTTWFQSEQHRRAAQDLQTFDCTLDYGHGTCEDCLVAYRRFLCAQFAPCPQSAADPECASGQRCLEMTPPCPKLCKDVLRLCPPVLSMSCPQDAGDVLRTVTAPTAIDPLVGDPERSCFTG